MFAKLFPRETCFYTFFEKQAELLVLCSNELFTLMTTGNEIPSIVSRIKSIEHEADEVTRHCLEELHKSFITPFERDDIYHLISQMDDVIDYMDDAAQCVLMYKIQQIPQDAIDLSNLLCQAAESLKCVTIGLRTNDQSKTHLEQTKKLQAVENQGVEVLHRAVGRLFEEESDIRMLIKWKEIYGHLEDAIDRCEDVSNTIEVMILEST